MTNLANTTKHQKAMKQDYACFRMQPNATSP